MKWMRFEAADGPAYGVVEGDEVEEVRGSPFGDYQRTGRRRKIADVKPLIPVVPATFYAAGVNYAGHIVAAATRKGVPPKIPEKADVGYRANSALIAEGEDIVIPADASENIQYEGELVVVIGKKAKNLTRENAMSCIFGYTIGNDLSERIWQKEDRTNWRSKNTDTFKPMGPWIETDVDLDAMETAVRVNGDEKIRFKTNTMVFGIAEYISTMTRYITLQPGDVIWMGTEGKGENLVGGDTVEVEISGIGTLRNRVVRAKS